MPASTRPNGLPYPIGSDNLGLTDTYIKNLADWLDAARNCRAKVHQLVLQTLTNNVLTAITFTGEEMDPTGMHSTVTNTSRITIARDGRYDVRGAVTFATNAAGSRQVGIYKSGALQHYVRLPGLTGAAEAIAAPACSILCTAGDYLELQVVQTSGGNLDTVVGASNTWLDVVLVGEV